MKLIFISVNMSTNKICNFGHLISPMNTSSHQWDKKSNSLVRNWQRRDCWAILFWRQWQKSCDCEFWILNRNTTKEVHSSHPKKEEHWHPHSCVPARWCTTIAQTKLSVLEATDFFLTRWTDNPWPPYSPGLNPTDYFLWVYLKERVNTSNPRASEELKESKEVKSEGFLQRC